MNDLTSRFQKGLFIPEHDLIENGCKACIWRVNDMCPHGITEDDIADGMVYEFTDEVRHYDNEHDKENFKHSVSEEGSDVKVGQTEQKNLRRIKGYCPEYSSHILSLYEDGDSISCFWEKFSLYMAKLQMMSDYQEFMKLNKEIGVEKDKVLNDKTLSSKDKATILSNYDIKLNTIRLWWERLNMAVRSGYSKIADREGRKSEGGQQAGILSAKTINFNINPQIENKKSEHIIRD
ncbi:MAG: hypothetical protein ABIJ08_06760 [Nanoarchaeota archaeon]|uniref:Uncharacterized protein n=1 Tax=viral metagenome TaxID=1070528 RepID=A0A6M3KY77_9ZZZZ